VGCKKNGISVSLIRNKRSAKEEKAWLGDQIFMSPAILAYKESLFFCYPPAAVGGLVDDA
jgi:hypothetical protein